jgi:hypothetical protein
MTTALTTKFSGWCNSSVPDYSVGEKWPFHVTMHLETRGAHPSRYISKAEKSMVGVRAVQ